MPSNPFFPPKHTDTQPAAWLFCRVIDNYGDIGVSLRLARRLNEAGFQVALWHDHPAALAKLLGDAQLPADIRAHHWQGDAAESIAAELAAVAPALMIETFGCNLPPAAHTARCGSTGSTSAPSLGRKPCTASLRCKPTARKNIFG